MIESKWRLQIFQLFDDSGMRRGVGRVVNVLLIILISLNILAVTLETVSDILVRYQTWFDTFEAISVFVFSVEYLLRLWVCVEDKRYRNIRFSRLRYALTPMALVDLLAILPFFLSLFFSLDLRFLRVLRLLRVFKLTRYSSAMNVLLDVFRSEASSLFAGFFILFVLLVLSASGAYLVEHEAQPDKFGSIPAAMWWAVATLTTVGYGDVTPITVGGKIFGALVTVVGVGMAALPAGILASGLANELSHKRDRLRRKLRQALEDGVIDHHEENELEALRKSLGVGKLEAISIREEYEDKLHFQATLVCPSCGESFKAQQKLLPPK